MSGNSGLHKANRAKKDEFYTQLSDIEKELRNYKEHFKNKVVLCNCDDPYESNFFKYFANNFNHLALKRLIVTCYATSPIKYGQLSLLDIDYVNDKSLSSPYKVIIDKVDDINKDGAIGIEDVEEIIKHKENTLTILKGDGDFRSEECIELLKEADIVVTNPPFSLFREYIDQLFEYNKKFIIIGNINAVTYKNVFPRIAANELWLGQSIHSGDREFRIPDDYPIKASGYRIDENGVKYIRVKGVRWFTNLDYKERHEDLILYERYSPEKYPKYDNYDAINVDKTKDIPIDYDGVMGVPITFLDKFNPDQFEIVAFRKGADGKDLVYSLTKCIDKDIELKDNALASKQASKQASTTILQNSCTTTSLDQSLTEKTFTEELQLGKFTTSIPGLIKNAEGKIGNIITYARITIRRKFNEN